jgi:hypothetical protein
MRKLMGYDELICGRGATRDGIGSNCPLTIEEGSAVIERYRRIAIRQITAKSASER